MDNSPELTLPILIIQGWVVVQLGKSEVFSCDFPGKKFSKCNLPYLHCCIYPLL